MMERDVILGYVCWAMAAALGGVVLTVVIASLIAWTMLIQLSSGTSSMRSMPPRNGNS